MKIETLLNKENLDYNVFEVYGRKVYRVNKWTNKEIKGYTRHDSSVFQDWTEYARPEDSEEIKRLNKCHDLLVDNFFMTLQECIKNGLDSRTAQNEGVKREYELATEHNCICVFNAIYNI